MTDFTCKSCGKRVHIRIDDEDLCEACLEARAKDTSHLVELIARKGRNMERLRAAEAVEAVTRRAKGEKELAVKYWQAQVDSNNREIDAEERFLGLTPLGPADMTTDEILKELDL